jgi:hypothetical protein
MSSSLCERKAGEASRRRYVFEAPLRSSIRPPGEIVLFVGSITRLNSVGVYHQHQRQNAWATIMWTGHQSAKEGEGLLRRQASILAPHTSGQCPATLAQRMSLSAVQTTTAPQSSVPQASTATVFPGQYASAVAQAVPAGQ